MSSLGEEVAAQTTKLLSRGGKLVLVVIDNQPSPFPTAEQQLQNFTKSVKRNSAFTIQATVKVKPTAILQEQYFGIPADVFFNILKEHADADAIISFVGAPKLTGDEQAGLPQKHPRLIAVYGLGFRGTGLKSALENKLDRKSVV